MNEELVNKIENHPKYIELISKRKSFSIKLGIFVLVMFYAYILTIAFNKENFGYKNRRWSYNYCISNSFSYFSN